MHAVHVIEGELLDFFEMIILQGHRVLDDVDGPAALKVTGALEVGPRPQAELFASFQMLGGENTHVLFPISGFGVTRCAKQGAVESLVGGSREARPASFHSSLAIHSITGRPSSSR